MRNGREHKNDIVAERLRALRRRAKLRQCDLAEVLGIPRRTYSNYETGKSELSLLLLVKLTDYYNTSIDYLVGLKDSETAHPRNGRKA